MTHKDWLATLPSQTLAQLTAQSRSAGYLHLVGYLALITALCAWIVSGAPLWWLALLPLSVLLTFLFTLQHECTHKTPFPNTAVNEWVGHATGLIILQPFLWFRYFHLAHHRHTNDPARDPELASPKPETWPAFLLHVSGLPTHIAKISQILRNAAGLETADYIPPSARAKIKHEARLMLAAYVLIFATVPQILWLWLIPTLLGQPFLRLYLLAEHSRCPEVADMFANTRTTFTTRAIRFIAWNMPYHAEHHTAPNVPFHNLPALHVLAREHLRVTAPGYNTFTRDYTQGLKPNP